MTLEDLIDIERTKGIQEIDFVGLLTERGYTVDTFAYQKAEHYLKTFNPTFIVAEVKLETENFEFDRAAQRKNTIICGLPKEKIVWYPTEADFNRAYCEERQIICKERPYSGGVICTLPCDLQVGFIAINAPTNFGQVIKDKVAEWIQSKTEYTVTISGNDILVDAQKVYGMYNIINKDVTVCGFNLAFDVDLDFITNVCKKEMVKVPAGLNTFGNFDRMDLVNEMALWLK